jgi:polysaccharide export outer membrane protein
MPDEETMKRNHDVRTIAAAALAGVLLVPASGGAQENGGKGAARLPRVEAVSSDYVLTIGDKLRVEVYREPQLSQSVEVRPDGKVTLPLVGDVSAAGITPAKLGESLSEKLRAYLTNPVVTVIVAEATPPAVYVMGEVNAPGMLPLRAPLNVMQALAMAGGFKEFANTKNIRILRRGASGIETIRFNYKEAVDSGTRPVVLQPGDTVVVP